MNENRERQSGVEVGRGTCRSRITATCATPRRFGLRMSRADSFTVERRRGWVESAGTPRRSPDDAWDEQRGDRIEMEKARPGEASVKLLVQGRYAGRRELHGVDADIR